MEEHKEEDEDDRRSISSLASARHPSFSGSLLLDKSLAPDLEDYARSPFAASQLFAAQADEPLDSIEEGSVPKRWRGQVYDLSERPETPMTDEEQHVWATRPNTAAPFRRPVDEDGKDDDGSMPTTEDEEAESQDAASPGSKSASQPTSADQSHGDIEYRSPRNKRVGFPRSDTMNSGVNSDTTADGRHPLTRVNSNLPLRTRLSSRTSQGGLTTLVDSEKPEGLWRTRSHSIA
jgi:1-phosphatidylinositol-3-phosphate 5-kinase